MYITGIDISLLAFSVVYLFFDLVVFFLKKKINVLLSFYALSLSLSLSPLICLSVCLSLSFS